MREVELAEQAGPDQDVSARRLAESRFSHLYRRHFTAVASYVARRADDPRIDLEDMVADIFTAAWRQLDRIPESPEDRLWLLGVARKIVWRHQRSASRRARLFGRLSKEPAEAGPEITVNPRVQTLRLALRRLPARDQEALRLILWENLTHRDASQVMGCTVNAFDVRLHRARERLAKLMDEEFAGHPHDDAGTQTQRKGN